MKYYIAILICHLFISCNNTDSDLFKEEREVKLEDIKIDSTIVFLDNNGDTLNIFRELEIIENDNTDTVSFGYSAIPPGFKGKVLFAQFGLDSTKAVYIDRGGPNPENSYSYSKMVNIGLKKNHVLKKMILKIRLKKDEGNRKR